MTSYAPHSEGATTAPRYNGGIIFSAVEGTSTAATEGAATAAANVAKTSPRRKTAVDTAPNRPAGALVPAAATSAVAPGRPGRCDGCSRRREVTQWRIRSMAAGQWCEASLCVDCATLPRRLVNAQHDPDTMRPVPISSLKPTPQLRRQARK